MPPDLRERLLRLARVRPVLAALDGEPGVWVVGGAIRDLLLGAEPDDLDLVVEGDAVAVGRRVAGRLGGAVAVHERFGTATVRTPDRAFDLAGTRRETYPSPGALPEVELGVALSDDLARRDFTVNTFAVRLADGALVHGPGAQDDLAAGTLRVLHDASFVDDPTRLLRLARYAARLGFGVEPHTAALAAAAVAAGAPATVSGERLGRELRLLAREPQPAALCALARFDLGAAVWPGFALDPAMTSRALALCPADGRADLVALGSATVATPPAVRAHLDALGFPAGERKVLTAAAGLPAVLARLGRAGSPSAVRRALLREPVEVAVLAAAAGDAGARRWLDDWRHVRAAITGHDLLAAGLHGPAVSAGLEAALNARLDGAAPTREAQLAAALAHT